MALVLADRVQETSTSVGTGTFTLAGAVNGFQSFAVIGNGNTTYYVIAGGNEWEVGIGTYTSSGTTLSRDTVLSSSNSNAKVDFSAGVKYVFVSYPEERAVYVNGSSVVIPNSATIPIANGGTGATTLAAANIPELNVANTFTGANTFRTASGTRFEESATQDAIIIDGRAGGTASYAVTIVPTTLSANRTLTLPNVTGTLATLGNANTWTALQTFAVTARTSGVASYFVVTTPADTGLTASTESIGANFSAQTRTWAAGALALQRERVFNTPTYAFASASTLTTAINVDIANPAAGANATITNAYALRAGKSLFTSGDVKVEAASTQDAVIISGRAGGTSSYAVTLTPATLTASRTLTLPDSTGTLLTSATGATKGFSQIMSMVFGL